MSSKTKRLVGRDGKLQTVTKGTAINGDGTTGLSNGFYVATKIAEDSGHPTGLKVGYPFKADSTVIPKEGEMVIPLILEDRCDVRDVSIEFKTDDLDVTTLCDTEKKYRAGFSEASGSLEGITTLNKTEDLLGKFADTVKQGKDLKNIEIKNIDDSALFINFELVKQKNDETYECFFAPVILNSFSMGAQIDSEQTFSSDFRITPDNDIKAVFYILSEE